MLDAAVTVFSRRGFHAASMDEIADEAGISKPMLYAYLGTKDELFVACLHREGTRLMEAIVRVVEPNLPPDEQLWRGMRAFFGFVCEHRAAWSLLSRQARGLGPFGPVIYEMRRNLVDVVTGLLARGITVAWGREADPDEVTAMAYALVGVAESLADWVVEHAREDPEVTATRVMNFVWLSADDRRRGISWASRIA